MDEGGPTAAPTPRPVAVLPPRLRARVAGAHVIAVDRTRTAGARSYVVIITRAKAGNELGRSRIVRVVVIVPAASPSPSAAAS